MGADSCCFEFVDYCRLDRHDSASLPGSLPVRRNGCCAASVRGAGGTTTAPFVANCVKESRRCANGDFSTPIMDEFFFLCESLTFVCSLSKHTAFVIITF
ncbi:unnamed protein product [Calypogeia fissa]